MSTKKKIKKIGVTINLENHMLANGMQQNIVFLVDCINKIPDKKCYFLCVGSPDDNGFVDKNLCISYEKYFSEKNIIFDLIIYAGFTPGQKKHLIDRERNKSTKYVCFLYGNELTDCIIYSLDNNFKKISREEVTPLDQIWTSPHYKRNLSFLETKFKNKNVKIAPFLWDSKFIIKQYQNLKIDKNFKEFKEFKESIDINKVTIFEPNISFVKTSLIPVYIVERFEQEFPNILSSCSVICGDQLNKSKYFASLVSNLEIYKKRPNFLKCYKRFPLLISIIKLGGLIISNQILNELNYLYLEALFLSLPLIHNSELLKDYGYYYEEFDIQKASNNIKFILENHKKNIHLYDKKSKELFSRFSPKSEHNIKNYETLIENI